MSFTGLSSGWIAAGLVGLAGALYLLQRLRVRYREHRVVTLVFWREAVLESRARVLVRRFRHPWAYALIVAIASLLWLALAGPEAGAPAGGRHVLILDGAAGMTAGDRFARAAEAVARRAAELPRTNTTVLLAAGRTTTLLAPGEPIALLSRRLAQVSPVASPGGFDRVVGELSALARDRDSGDESPIAVDLFGAAPCREDGALNGTVRVRRLWAPQPIHDNGGVIALGVSESASGHFDRVDVLARGVVPNGRDLVLTLDGQPLPSAVAPREGPELRVIARDVPARGGRIVARVTGVDGLAIDDAASRILPDRPPIRVEIVGVIPIAVRDVLAADPSVVLVAEGAEVLVGNSVAAGATPTLAFVADAGQPAAFLIDAPAGPGGVPDVAGIFTDLGLSEIDANALAGVAGRPITLTVQDATVRRVAMWEGLAGASFDLIASRAFPIVAGRIIRWLAQRSGVEGEVAAGQPRAVGWTDAGGRKIDALGAEAAIPAAGDLAAPDGRVLHASLLDVGTTVAVDMPSHAAEMSLPVWRPLPWLVALASALLILEWWLFARERIP